MTDSTPATAALSVGVLAYLRYRATCFCGEAKGHVGWLVCAEKATKEVQEALDDAG